MSNYAGPTRITQYQHRCQHLPLLTNDAQQLQHIGVVLRNTMVRPLSVPVVHDIAYLISPFQSKVRLDISGPALARDYGNIDVSVHHVSNPAGGGLVQKFSFPQCVIILKCTRSSTTCDSQNRRSRNYLIIILLR